MDDFSGLMGEPPRSDSPSAHSVVCKYPFGGLATCTCFLNIQHVAAPNPLSWRLAGGRVFGDRNRDQAAHAIMNPTQPSGVPDEAAVGALLRAAPGVPVVISAWDSGEIIALSEAAARLLGASGDALTGRSIVDFHVDPAEHGALLQRIEGGSGAAQAELAMRAADGRAVWMAVSAWRIAYGGRPVLLIIGYDMTAHHERARQLVEAQERL